MILFYNLKSLNKRWQILKKQGHKFFFETSPEELRKLANILEKTEPNLINSEATFFLNEVDEDNFNDEDCIRFVKSKSK